MDEFGPGDTWPEHPDPSYRGPLRYAQEARWDLLKYEGHSWGRLVCNRTRSKGNRCEILILRSAKGGESFALGIRTKIDGCPHGKGRKRITSAERAAAADERLDEAERLVKAARRCLDSQTKLEGAAELLSLAEKAVESADAVLTDAVMLDQAVELESEGLTDRDEATALADAAGYPSDSPIEPLPLLDEASSRVQQVIHETRSSSDRPRIRVRERARSMRATIDAMRSELAG